MFYRIMFGGIHTNVMEMKIMFSVINTNSDDNNNNSSSY